MGKAFLCKSNGGGGGGLAFRVLGGTSAPSNQKPNDIWVNTGEEITSYIFSATEPEGYANGMVWITIGASSPVAFNALKKNGVMVYPLSAKQYIDGAWVDVTAKSYQNGEWVDWWNGELYISGNEYTNFTGGWSSYYTYHSSYPNRGTLTKNADSLEIVANGASNIVAQTVNKIDITNYTSAEFEVECISRYSTYPLVLFVDNKNDSNYNTSRVASKKCELSSGKSGTFSVDISALTGMHYVGFQTWVYEQAVQRYKIKKVMLK
jgi:hypothetical protein